MRILRDLAPAVDGVGQAEAGAFHSLVCVSRWAQVIGAVVLAVEADAGQARDDGLVLVGQQPVACAMPASSARYVLATLKVRSARAARPTTRLAGRAATRRPTAARAHAPDRAAGCTAADRRGARPRGSGRARAARGIARPGDLVGLREGDGVGEGGWVHGIRITKGVIVGMQGSVRSGSTSDLNRAARTPASRRARSAPRRWSDGSTRAPAAGRAAIPTAAPRPSPTGPLTRNVRAANTRPRTKTARVGCAAPGSTNCGRNAK